jgi:hypothetical protein
MSQPRHEFCAVIQLFYTSSLQEKFVPIMNRLLEPGWDAFVCAGTVCDYFDMSYMIEPDVTYVA